MKFFQDLASLAPLKKKEEEDDDEEDEEGGFSATDDDEGQGKMTFLNTYQGLLKLIGKYTNKTFKKKSKAVISFLDE